MTRGVHGEKLVAAINSPKVPATDKERLQKALDKYDLWISEINTHTENSVDSLITSLVQCLTNYKYYIDVDLIFDSQEDFLYRQKGQMKLDNTIVEEFLPILVRRCIELEYGACDYIVDSQKPIFSSAYFNSSLSTPEIGGGLEIKTKDQDFSISREIHLRSSYSGLFSSTETREKTTYLGYVLAEIKTNLDKTMFQEASATAHDVKLAVTGAKYYLLCDFLDMTPISTSTTDIEEILILRKAKRMSSNIRKNFNTFAGRQAHRDEYVYHLDDHPYSAEVFQRFVNHIFDQINNESLIEGDVLDIGYF
ncbi:Bpu10I family restriction endonuclease [Bifidobacterium avesanii]|uniref:Bpu10I family restriction endonuclease n=1 Tax=Bifidobacterium avesanii TaxID=1798157 RepID=A0A7K3TIL8_9BIFI|nr:Bpu10I family restriction endonuclease [Bifidobacterium avesanii]KAB8290104.1 Bpu10I restriction endonuclease [Bifidobacterium avesanii]NEG78947.1 Bpu10I family restriction endonuclease [Bifidobacterium avesanii]